MTNILTGMKCSIQIMTWISCHYVIYLMSFELCFKKKGGLSIVNTINYDVTFTSKNLSTISQHSKPMQEITNSLAKLNDIDSV